MRWALRSESAPKDKKRQCDKGGDPQLSPISKAASSTPPPREPAGSGSGRGVCWVPSGKQPAPCLGHPIVWMPEEGGPAFQRRMLWLGGGGSLAGGPRRSGTWELHVEAGAGQRLCLGLQGLGWAGPPLEARRSLQSRQEAKEAAGAMPRPASFLLSVALLGEGGCKVSQVPACHCEAAPPLLAFRVIQGCRVKWREQWALGGGMWGCCLVIVLAPEKQKVCQTPGGHFFLGGGVSRVHVCAADTPGVEALAEAAATGEAPAVAPSPAGTAAVSAGRSPVFQDLHTANNRDGKFNWGGGSYVSSLLLSLPFHLFSSAASSLVLAHLCRGVPF